MKSLIATLLAAGVSFVAAVVGGKQVSAHFFHHSPTAILVAGLVIGVVVAVAITKAYNSVAGRSTAVPVQGS